MIGQLILCGIAAALIGIAAITILNTLTFPRLTETSPKPHPPTSSETSPPDPLSMLERGSKTGRHSLSYGEGGASAPGEMIVLTGVSALGRALPGEASLPLHDEQVARGEVSFLIPARNESAVIAQTVQALLAQDHSNLEIIVLDDHSDDGTGDIVRGLTDARVRVIEGAALPLGWLGKNWACQQLADAATGDILIFTDADVTWQRGALTALLDMMTRNRADLLSVWSTQITVTWGERLIVPLIALVIMGYLPGVLVNRTRWTPFAAANGQVMAFLRAAYGNVGGHAAVRGQITEDIAFARLIKSRGLRLLIADGAGLITCRMYRGWDQVRDGFAKNIIAGYGGVVGLLLGTIFHLLVFIIPVGVLLVEPAWGIALLTLGVGVRALSAAATRQRVGDALLMPLSALLMTVIAAQALYWRIRYGGVLWKGRILR